MPYIAHHVAYDSVLKKVRNVAIRPKHGDVRTDFTNGVAYIVYPFKESMDVNNQHVGTLSMSDGLFGSNVDLSALFTEGDHGVLNAGYFNGKTWVNQTLGSLNIIDTGTSSARVLVKLSRPLKDIEGVYILDSTGEAVLLTNSSATAPLAYFVNSTISTLAVNISAYTTLGFTGEVDLLDNTALLIKYTTYSRRPRPIDNPTDVKLLGDAWVLWHPHKSFGGVLAWELSEYIYTATSSGAPKVSPIKGTVIYPATGKYDLRFYIPEFSLPALQDTSLTMIVGGLCNINGMYGILLWSMELIYDSDWGISGELPIVNQRQTDIDENGNVIYVDCMVYEPGVAVPA